MALAILLVVLFVAVLVTGGAAFGPLCALILVVQGWLGAVLWRRGGHHGH